MSVATLPTIQGVETNAICLHCMCQAEFLVNGVEYMCRAEVHNQYPEAMEMFEESEVDAMREEAETLHEGMLSDAEAGYFDDGHYDDDPNPYAGTGGDW